MMEALLGLMLLDNEDLLYREDLVANDSCFPFFPNGLHPEFICVSLSLAKMCIPQMTTSYLRYAALKSTTVLSLWCFLELYSSIQNALASLYFREFSYVNRFSLG